MKQTHKFFANDVLVHNTDSVYIQDKNNNKEKLMQIIKEIIEEIKSKIPFPVNTFDMDIDYEIDFISFFKGATKNENEKELDDNDKKNKELGLLKKNYLFSYKKDNIHDIYVKNLGIVKRSNTDLSRKIFWEKLKPLILKEHKAKFSNQLIKDWIKSYIEKDISLFTRRFIIKNKTEYKVQGCIQVQIHDYIPIGQTNPLGAGTYFLIPNKKIGVGKGVKKYCTLNEYKEKLNYNDLYLDVAMRELSYFNENYIPDIIKNKKVKVVSFIDTLKQEGLW